MEHKCKNHPKYRGLRLPIISCPGCWFLYFIFSDKWEANVEGIRKSYIQRRVR